jgi:hypothetical protein
MRCRNSWLLGATALFLLSAGNGLAAEPALADSKAAQLVTRAMEAGIAGDQQKRRSLLNEAIEVAPEFAPAHWQLGHVRRDGKWQTTAEFTADLARDGHYAEYRKLRSMLPESAAGHLKMARWCHEHGLSQEEELHWYGVLSLQPGHLEAVKALGLHKYRNHWLTLEQIEHVKRGEREFEKALEFWKPRLERWAEAIEKDETEPLEQLRAIDDPATIPWLEAYLSTRSAQLGSEVVDLVARMQCQEGTDSLVRHALASEFPEVRAAATRKLKEVPLKDFAGELVGSLTSPPEFKSESLYACETYWQQASVMVERLGDKAQFDDMVSLVGGINVHVAVNGLTGIPLNGPRGVFITASHNPVDLRAVAAARTRANTVALNAVRLELRNQRICELLQALTGQEFARDQNQWWKWWLDQTEQIVPATKQLTRLTAYQTGIGRSSSSSSICSCFDADTPVHTKQGLQRIIDIKPGDYILCQNERSGETGYRLVMNTTVRPATKMLLITAGEDQLEATLGHPFWVVGEGWTMAKELKVGDQLHSLGGIEVVRDLNVIEKETSAYNLIVADFANYFVGKSAILAHDNTSRRPTRALVPGLPIDD